MMQIKIMKCAILLAIGLASPAWAASRDLPSPPVQGKQPLLLNEPPPKPVKLPAPARGQLLYENHCVMCHESVAHVRPDRRARSLAEIRAWVMYWSDYLKLRWGKEEVEDVVNELDRRFYKIEIR